MSPHSHLNLHPIPLSPGAAFYVRPPDIFAIFSPMHVVISVMSSPFSFKTSVADISPWAPLHIFTFSNRCIPYYPPYFSPFYVVAFHVPLPATEQAVVFALGSGNLRLTFISDASCPCVSSVGTLLVLLGELLFLPSISWHPSLNIVDFVSCTVYTS